VILLGLDWLLDVVEHVLWDRAQNSSSQRLGQGVLVRVLQVLNEIVSFSLLEDGKLAIQVGVPLVNWHVVGVLALLEQDDAQLVLILLECTVNSGLVGEELELAAKQILLHLLSELLILDLVNEGAVLVLASASHWVKEALGKRALLESEFGLGHSWDWLLSLVGLKGLLVLEESGILLSAVGQELLSSLDVVSHVDILEVALNVGLISLGDVVLDLPLVLISLLGVLVNVLRGVFNLEHLQAKTLLPVFEEARILLIRVEGGCAQLLAPNWSVGHLHSIPHVA